MASLELTFSEIYLEVWNLTADSTDKTTYTKAKSLVYRGYRQFLYPINPRTGRYHQWSFMKKISTVNTIADQWEYDLPADFDYFFMMPKFVADTNYPNPSPASVERIIEMRSLGISGTYPAYCALQAGQYAPATGQKYKLLLHPPPNGVYGITFGYVMSPPKPTEDTDCFIGGMKASEAILQSALAVAERTKEDNSGVHTREAARLIGELIKADVSHAPSTVGYNLNPQAIFDSPEIAREMRWIEAATDVYGIS
ncbi:MAG: hypothetical protein WC451_03195 [Patescibacteria group bacterium]